MSVAEQGERVAAAFRERHGREPEGVWAAPGRVNLIGEHTDYNDGFMLPVAIDRQVVVAAGRRGDRRLTAASLEQDGVLDMATEDIGPGRVDGWGAYPAGVLWSLGVDGLDVGGADLVLSGDVPGGAGLSSSAAIECATGVALVDLAGLEVDPTRLALVAQRAEIEVAGVPCGVMDQMASMLGRADHAVFIDARSLAAESIATGLAAAGLSLLVMDTRVTHALNDGSYAERRRQCEEAAAELGVPALRDVTPADVDGARDRLGDVHFRRARHITTENERVLATVALMRDGGVDRLGDLLAASHASMRDDFEISCPELDVAVDTAVRTGAVGARMTGGGFGGSALALVAPDAVDAVRTAVTEAFAREGFRAPNVFVVAVGDGARRLR